ncbi:MAG: transporter [Gemmatimonadaceae bacterium]
MRNSFLFLFLAATGPLTAQGPVPAPERDTPSPIEDNSFLVEEAYNQERGIVQHANTFSRSRGSAAWTYTFTQEWPVGGQRNQLSYTLPLARNDDPAEETAGIGDIALNYRYQIGGGEGPRLAFAPRATLLLPTGSSRRGLGSGGTGFQINLPLSAKLSPGFVAHSNAGLTYTPRARDTFGNVAAARSYTLGQSIIWLTHPKLNLMLESTWTASHDVSGAGQTQRSTEFLLSPGVRGAIDFASGLQIVPGIAFPFDVGASRGERGVYFYLSFEHSFLGQSP